MFRCDRRTCRYDVVDLVNDRLLFVGVVRQIVEEEGQGVASLEETVGSVTNVRAFPSFESLFDDGLFDSS